MFASILQSRKTLNPKPCVAPTQARRLLRRPFLRHHGFPSIKTQQEHTHQHLTGISLLLDFIIQGFVYGISVSKSLLLCIFGALLEPPSPPKGALKAHHLNPGGHVIFNKCDNKDGNNISGNNSSDNNDASNF